MFNCSSSALSSVRATERTKFQNLLSWNRRVVSVISFDRCDLAPRKILAWGLGEFSDSLHMTTFGEIRATVELRAW